MALTLASIPARDRRSTERVATALRAKLFPGAVDCVIADFNKRGARLRLSGPADLSGRIIVVVWSSGLAFEAERRWTHGAEIGVQFSASRDLRRPAPPHLAEIQALWLNRRPRLARRELVRTGAIIEKRSRPSGRPDWMRPRSAPPI